LVAIITSTYCTAKFIAVPENELDTDPETVWVCAVPVNEAVGFVKAWVCEVPPPSALVDSPLVVFFIRITLKSP